MTTPCPTTAARTTSTRAPERTSSSPTRSARGTCSTAGRTATTPTGRTSTRRSRSTWARRSRAWPARREGQPPCPSDDVPTTAGGDRGCRGHRASPTPCSGTRGPTSSSAGSAPTPTSPPPATTRSSPTRARLSMIRIRSIDCGEGWDTAQIDHPENGPDTAPIACESIHERDPNSFRPPDTPTVPPGPAAADDLAGCRTHDPAARPSPDVEAPQPRDHGPLHRPAKSGLHRAPWRRRPSPSPRTRRGASFRCKLDRRPVQALPLAPRLPAHARPSHVSASSPSTPPATAIDSPALFRFAVRRLSPCARACGSSLGPPGRFARLSR